MKEASNSLLGESRHLAFTNDRKCSDEAESTANVLQLIGHQGDNAALHMQLKADGLLVWIYEAQAFF